MGDSQVMTQKILFTRQKPTEPGTYLVGRLTTNTNEIYDIVQVRLVKCGTGLRTVDLWWSFNSLFKKVRGEYPACAKVEIEIRNLAVPKKVAKKIGRKK